MQAIYRGRRHLLVGAAQNGVWLEEVIYRAEVARRICVQQEDPDLILDPTSDDLDLADAFERGEINAFEYPDGHTYPPNRQISGSDDFRVDDDVSEE